MTDSDEDWVKAAMTDDAMVAELLLGLRTSSHQQQPPPPKRGSPAPPLDWSVRQRRSRHPTRHHGVALKKMKKTAAAAAAKAEPTRASPTTPLSWSGATSVSGGSEESSKPSKPAGGSRSKVSVRSEATTSKRPRKKKTLAELKEEETLLLKERKNLRNEIATMRLNLEKQRAKNESLNRLKLDSESQQQMKTANAAISSKVIIDEPKQVDSVCEPHSILLAATNRNGLEALERFGASNASCKLEEIDFYLPDLNFPPEGDLGAEVFRGMS